MREGQGSMAWRTSRFFRRATSFCGIERDEILKKFCSSLAQAAEG